MTDLITTEELQALRAGLITSLVELTKISSEVNSDEADLEYQRAKATLPSAIGGALGVGAGMYRGLGAGGDLAESLSRRGGLFRNPILEGVIGVGGVLGGAALGGLGGYGIGSFLGKQIEDSDKIRKIDRNLQAIDNTKLMKSAAGFKPVAKLQAEVAKDCDDCKKEDSFKPAKLAAMVDELRLMGAVEECQARELEKRALGEVSEVEARSSLDRLQRLEQGKPTMEQLGRGAAVGAVVGPLAALAGRAVAGRSVRAATDQQFLPQARQLAAQIGHGTIFGGLTPALTSRIERGAEVNKLKGYLNQQEQPSAEVI